MADTKPRVVTIDGPAGAGKSTVARRLAERLGWRLLDTGAMYRAVALAAHPRRGRPRRATRRSAAWPGRSTSACRPAGSCSTARTSPPAIRSVEVTRATRHAGRQPGRPPAPGRLAAGVRPAEGDVVAEGRDQGTIVFPDAFRKFFLTASDEERARRRHRRVRRPGRADRPSRRSSPTSASATPRTPPAPSPR